MRIGGIYGDIRMRTDKLPRDLDKAHGMVRGAADKIQKRIDALHLKALALATSAAAGMIAKASIKAASDLQEVTSKFNVVFASQQRQAEQWSQVLVDSYAMSTREAKQYLSSVQDLLVPMGMAAKEAGALSNEIVKLSADLGSFNNLPTAQVMGDIQSALVGNYETMKKYGVVLNATVTQEKALAMGLAGTKKELTASHKAQAAYVLMVEGSTAAIGDMARTSNDYANQLKKLQANAEDLKALLGTELLPVATDVVKQMNEWVKANDKLIKQKIPEYVERAKDALLKIWEIVSYDPEILKYGLIGLVVGGKKGAVLIGGMAHMVQWAGNLAEAFDYAGKGVIDFGDIAAANFKELEKLLESARKTGVQTFKIYEQGVKGVAEATKGAAETTTNFGVAMEDLSEIAKANIKSLEDYVTAHQEAQQKMRTSQNLIGLQKFAGPMSDPEAHDKIIQAQKEAQEEALSTYQHFLENVHDITADTFYDIFDGTIDGWGDLMDRMGDYFKRLLAEMAAQAIARPIIVPMVSGMMGSLGFGGMGFGGVANAATVGGYGTPMGAGLANYIPGVSSFLAAPAWGTGAAASNMGYGMGNLGLNAAGQYTGAYAGSVAPSWGALAGYGALGSLGYSTIGNWVGLPQGEYTGITSGLGAAAGYAGGTALGATYGSWLGPVGTILGAIGGGLLGSLFGGDGDKHVSIQSRPSIKYGQDIDWGMYRRGIPYQGGVGSYEQRYASKFYGKTFTALDTAVDEAVKSVYGQVDSVLSALPENISNNISNRIDRLTFTFNADKSWVIDSDKIEEDMQRILADVGTTMWDKIQPVLASGFSQHIKNQLSSNTTLGMLSGDSTISRLLANRNIFTATGGMASGANIDTYLATASQLITALSQTQGAWDGITAAAQDLLDPLSPVEQNMRQINIQFDQMVGTLEALGFASRYVNEIEADRALVLQNAVDDYVTDITTTVQDMLDPLSPLEQSIRRINTQFDEMVGTLEALGFTTQYINDIEADRALVLQDAVDDYVAGITDQVGQFQRSYQDFMGGMSISSLAPVQGAGAMQAEFERMMGLAGSGETRDIQNLYRFVQSDFLPFMKDYTGGGQDYADIFGATTGRLSGMTVDLGPLNINEDRIGSAVANAIRTELAPLLVEKDGVIHIHVNIDSREVGDVIAQQMETNENIIRVLDGR